MKKATLYRRIEDKEPHIVRIVKEKGGKVILQAQNRYTWRDENYAHYDDETEPRIEMLKTDFKAQFELL